MWATFLHLTVGNLLVGIFEAVLVRKLFHLRGGGVFGWIVAANYASCIVGYILLWIASEEVVRLVGGPLPVYHVGRIQLVFVLLSFVLTIVVEWPLFWLALRRKANTSKLPLRATVVANAASYALLIVWNWLASTPPARWGVRLIPPNDFPRNRDVSILYIGDDNRHVYRMRLDGSAPSLWATLAEPMPDGVLGISSKRADGRWRVEVQPDYNRPAQFVGSIAAARAAVHDPGNSSWMGFEATRLVSQAESPWIVRFGGWWLEADHGSDASLFLASIEAPWLGWRMCNPILLPHDQLLEMGPQIMCVDLMHRTAAAIAPGHGPAAVIDEAASPP